MQNYTFLGKDANLRAFLCTFAFKKEEIMGFWKNFFGAETDPEEQKKNSEEKNFDLLKYDGVKAMRIGQTDYAVKCFIKALETKDDPELHDYLSRAYLRLGKNDEALAELLHVVDMEPDNVNLMMQAASVAFINEDYDAMTNLCSKALAVDPDNALVHLFNAKAELGKGQLVQGIAMLTRAIALDEQLADARLLRGQTLLGMGDLTGCQEDADWLQAHTADNEDVLLLSARLLAAQQQTDAAIEAYGRVIEVNPFCVDAFRERGRLRLDAGDKTGAEEDMRQVLELNPQETADVSGDYSAEGIEHKVKQAYSNLNPFGI